MLSAEMQVILVAALVALCIAVIWALWRRSARQNVTVLLLGIGTVLLLAGGGPLFWWQTHLQSTLLQPTALSDHRIAGPIVREADGYRRLEIDIELMLSRLPEARLEEIARAALQQRLSGGRFDLARVRLRELGTRTPSLYLYAHKKQIDPEQIRAWLRPDPAEVIASAQLSPPKQSELGNYHTLTFTVRTSTKWETLHNLLKSNALPLAWGALDETLYDYITVFDGETVALILLFAIVNEDFLRQYQSAGGRPEELGFLGAAIPMPSILVMALAMSEATFHLGELSLVQSQEGESRRVELRELALKEELDKRLPWTRLLGNFPQFPNLLAQLRAGEQLIGLLRFPPGFESSRGFQLYYGSRWAGLLQK